jgi:hypothetical protein
MRFRRHVWSPHSLSPKLKDMATVKTQISENDYVELINARGKWPAGTRGTAVSDHGVSKLIEISNDRGEMLDLLEVSEEDLHLISQHPLD